MPWAGAGLGAGRCPGLGAVGALDWGWAGSWQVHWAEASPGFGRCAILRLDLEPAGALGLGLGLIQQPEEIMAPLQKHGTPSLIDGWH